MSSRMFKPVGKQKPAKAILPLEEEVWFARRKGLKSIRVFGIDLDIDTPADYLCVQCMKRGVLNTPFLVDGNLYCAVHMELTGEQSVHKVDAGYDRKDAFRYGDELSHRIKEIEKMTEDRQGYAVVVKPSSPLLPSGAEKKSLVSDYIKSSLVPRSSFGEYAEAAAECLAIIALVHGLDPMLGEVAVWPITRYNPQAKRMEVIGIQPHIGVYGYQRQADKLALEGNPYAWGEMEVLSKDQKTARGAHICPTCSGKKMTGKGKYEKPCARCKGQGEFDPDTVIVVRREIFSERQAVVSLRIGLKPIPINGYGVFRPGDSIPEGRDPQWRAESRATKDAFKKMYSLEFWMPTREMLDTPVPEGTVFVENDNGDVVDVTPIVVEESSEVKTEIDETDRKEPDFTEYAFDDAPDGFEKYLLKGEVARLGYAMGAPQNGLIEVLFGDEAAWSSLTAGQARNMWEYAKRASAAAVEGMKGKAYKEYKTKLKDICRKYTDEKELWEHMEDTTSDR